MRRCGQAHTNVEPAVRCILVPSPRYKRRRETALSHFGFAKPSDQAAKIIVTQQRNIVSGDFEHKEDWPP
jgi:hypothetical protein